MRITRYKGRHLKPRPNPLIAPAAAGTATAVLLGSSPAHAAGQHRVRSGETLSQIGARYGVGVAKLAKANGIRNPNRIIAGRRLTIPGTRRVGGGHRTYVVRAGDTLSHVAARFGTNVNVLARRNRISNPSFIVTGQRLRISSGRARAGSSNRIMRGAGGRTYVVRRGDTLSAVAGRFGTTSRAIARRNGIRNLNMIRIGERLRLPRGANRKPAGRRLQRSSHRTIGALLHRQAVAHGISPSLVKAVAWQESGWKQHVVSSAGAIGVMQVMPGTADYVNRVLRHGNLNVRRTHDNVHLGVAYLRHMLRLFGGNERKALAAYYSGPGNVKRRLNRIQRPYVRSVRALKRRF